MKHANIFCRGNARTAPKERVACAYTTLMEGNHKGLPLQFHLHIQQWSNFDLVQKSQEP